MTEENKMPSKCDGKHNGRSQQENLGESGRKQHSLLLPFRSVADVMGCLFKSNEYGGVKKFVSVLFLLLLSGLAWAGDGLEWAHSDNGKDINWQKATQYCASNGKGWRLPTEAELLANYQSGHEKLCGFYSAKCKVSSNSRLTGPAFWTNEEYLSSTAWSVNLISGSAIGRNVEHRSHLRALCVRRL